MDYNLFNEYFKEVISAISRLDPKEFYATTEALVRRVDKSLRPYLEKVLEDKEIITNPTNLIFRRWDIKEGRYKSVEGEEAETFLQDFLIAKLFAVLACVLPEESTAQFFHDIWEGRYFGVGEQGTKDLELLDIGLKELESYTKKLEWDHKTRLLLNNWLAWNSIKVLDENYSRMCGSLMLSLENSENILREYGIMRRKGHWTAPYYMKLARESLAKAREKLLAMVEYVKGRLNEFSLEGVEWYDEDKPKAVKPVSKEKPTERSGEIEETPLVDRILALLQKNPMTAQSISQELGLDTDKLAPAITELRTKRKIQLNRNFEWEIVE